MKTLNQFYDDSMGRAYIEVPDDEGRETRTYLDGFSHGCRSDVCQGVDPVDYDGSQLNNTADIAMHSSKRLLSRRAVNSPSRGTAEPEMRGLYILLTMNNDGGMEVMRYTAVLYRERPEIYHSKPVQLALDIFKVSVRLSCIKCSLHRPLWLTLFACTPINNQAKKDYNYVLFFKILKDPSTPYLFACLMVCPRLASQPFSWTPNSPDAPVQTRRGDAEDCVPYHVQNIWSQKEGQRRANLRCLSFEEVGADPLF